MLFTKVKTAVVVIVAGALLGTGVMVVSQKSGPADAQEKMGPAVQPGLASGAKPDGPSLGGEVTDKAGDDRAMRRALLAHAQSAAIDKLPRFSYQVKYRHGRVDSMRAVDVSLEHLNEGLTAAVLDKDWTGWCETSFSWDEKRVLSEMKLWKTRSGCSAKFWTASEAWDRYQADDNSPACFVRLAGHAQLWKNLRMFDYGYLRLTPHRYWWGQTVSPGNNNLTMSLVRPDKAAWRYLGTEKCGNETCDVVDSLRRGQRLWIGQDTGHVHRASACWPTYMPAGRDTAEGATFFKTDVVRGIAGKAFASGREYGNWCSNEATDDQIVQLETAFAERFAPRSVPQITPNELIQFEDYREIAPGVWLPFREIRTFPHPSETVQGKSVIIRSELCVLEVRTDLDLSDRFAQLLPKDGEEVEDQRFIPPVNFLYRAGEADE